VNRVVAPDDLLPTCRALAQDMLSCDRETLRQIKRVYDEGFRNTLAEGLRIEARTSIEHARAVRPEQVAARRRAIQERGRKQSG
jgi:enoyl-CoA hydratase